MSGIPMPVQDDYARGKGLAAIAIITRLLRKLVEANALSAAEVRAVLNEAAAGFAHANPTDIEAMALATIVQVTNDSVPQSP